MLLALSLENARFHIFTTTEEDISDEHDHHERRHRDLLQRLGHRPGRHLFAWVAAQYRCVGWPNAVPRAARLSLHCARPQGHGRSSQASAHNDMDGYADDLAALIEALDLREATLVGHSTGGGEVARYIGRHGRRRVKKAVLIAAVPPLMLQTQANPEGLPMEVFDAIRAGVAGDRSQYYKDLAIAFYGANRSGAKVSQGILDQFWLWSMQAGAKGAYDSIKAFSETDFTEDLKKIRRADARDARRR